ncbi:helix-turn-helix domain-containing protein [Aneurinibacillus migulanus]|uniref:helix-turn-helix domain-containing protein n=1 Tax=Aneurinibacillus migulanus TaxID=47500 RepID=UPI0006B58518|nr:helix-turn-helix transcriptional regulator [Aneurinibacillus migulanus]
MDMKIIDERIRKARVERNETLNKAAEQIGIQKGSLSGIENGKKNISLETLIKTADHFNVSLDYLTGRSEIPEILETEEKK